MSILNQSAVYIPVSEVFPGIESDFETFTSLLESLSRTDTLFWCARLNLVLSDPSTVDHIEKQQFCLSKFLTPDQINRVNAFVRAHSDARHVTVFFRGQLLELVRWVALYCNDQSNDGVTFENLEIRQNFAQAALIASDIWSKRVFGNRFSLEGGVEIARERALGAIRKSIEGTSVAPDLGQSLGRGWALFKDYYPSFFPTFEQQFQASTGLSVEQYYICLAGIMTNFMNPRIGPGLFRVDNVPSSYRAAFEKYFALKSQTPDELRYALWGTRSGVSNFEAAPPYDYRPLRDKPILRGPNGRAIILDARFYSETASVSPLFLMKKERPEDANQMFSAFGLAFQSYACDILRRMFPDISGWLSKRLACDVQGRDQANNSVQIDACLNDVTEAVLFEMKTALIPEEDVLTDENERYLKRLRERYVVTPGAGGGGKPKGVGQLARVVNLLASKEWLGEEGEFREVRFIYPLLVVHDPFLDAPVHGHFLASEFKKLISPDAELQFGELKKGRLHIAPLIVMSIDDLETLETSVEYFGLRDLLCDYSRSHPDRLVSLHNFIALSPYRQRMYHSRSTADKAHELLSRAKEVLFPNAE